MEVRVDWPVRPGHDAFYWLYYTVEKLPEIIIESNAVYVLEYEVKTNTWSLFRLEKVNNTIIRSMDVNLWRSGLYVPKDMYRITIYGFGMQ